MGSRADPRYGNLLKTKLNTEQYSSHFSLVLSLISFHNGDLSRVKEIIEFIEKKKSFITDSGRQEEFEKIKKRFFND